MTEAPAIWSTSRGCRATGRGSPSGRRQSNVGALPGDEVRVEQAHLGPDVLCPGPARTAGYRRQRCRGYPWWPRSPEPAGSGKSGPPVRQSRPRALPSPGWARAGGSAKARIPWASPGDVHVDRELDFHLCPHPPCPHIKNSSRILARGNIPCLSIGANVTTLFPSGRLRRTRNRFPASMSSRRRRGSGPPPLCSGRIAPRRPRGSGPRPRPVRGRGSGRENPAGRSLLSRASRRTGEGGGGTGGKTGRSSPVDDGLAEAERHLDDAVGRFLRRDRVEVVRFCDPGECGVEPVMVPGADHTIKNVKNPLQQ